MPPLPVSCDTRPHLPPASTPFVPVAARTPSSRKKRRRPSAHRPDSLRTSSAASPSAGKQRRALHLLGRNAAPLPSPSSDPIRGTSTILVLRILVCELLRSIFPIQIKGPGSVFFAYLMFLALACTCEFGSGKSPLNPYSFY